MEHYCEYIFYEKLNAYVKIDKAKKDLTILYYAYCVLVDILAVGCLTNECIST